MPCAEQINQWKAGKNVSTPEPGGIRGVSVPRKTSGPESQGLNWKSKDDVTVLGKELIEDFKKDRVTTLAAAFAYHTVFAIPALLILTLSLAALLESVTSVRVTENLREMIQDRAPADTKELLNSIVDNAIAQVSGGGASLGVLLTALLALWSGSNAVNALVESFNLAYGVEEGRPFVRKKLLVLGLTLLLALMINLSFVLLVYGERIGSWIADKAGLGSAFDVTWNIARWPLAIVAISFILAVLYYAGPNIEQSFRWISPGSVLATVLWLVATAGFGLYLRFSNPGSAYGVLGSVLVLLFYLYVTGIIFLIGAELNALLGRRYDPETVEDLATRPDADPEKRPNARQQPSRAHS
jgi:membrane protein